jgi:hypothetical protein
MFSFECNANVNTTIERLAKRPMRSAEVAKEFCFVLSSPALATFRDSTVGAPAVIDKSSKSMLKDI